MTRKKLYSLLLALLLFSQSAICYGATYQITEAELTQLESNLDRQQAIIKQLKAELQMLKQELPEANKQLQVALQQLKTAQDELNKVQQELVLLKVDLINSKSSLDKANQLLVQYEKDTNKAIRTAKAQKTLAWAIAGAAIVWGARK